MKIAICDNEQEQQKHLLQLLYKEMIRRGCEYQVSSFDNGEALLEKAATEAFDIVFLDIYMQEMNGITTAKELRKLQDAKIVFVTTSTDFAVDAFQIHAAHYLVKPVQPDDFKEALDRCLPIDDHVAIHTLKTTEGTICLREDHICFIEATGKYSLLYTIDAREPYQCPYAFRQFVEGMQSEDLVQCHRSYVVNLNYAQNISNTEITMKDNRLIPLSRKEKPVFMEKYKSYLFRQAKKG